MRSEIGIQAMKDEAPTQIKGGLLITVHGGWVKLMRGSMSAFDGRPEEYPDRGYPLLLMEPDVGHELVSLIPCGHDSHSVWIRGPEQCPDLPHGLLGLGRDDFRKKVFALPSLVVVAPRNSLRSWPHYGAPAADLTLPPHNDCWDVARSIYNVFTAKTGVAAAIERYFQQRKAG